MGKHLQTVVAVTCMKTLLMIFNFLFWLTGIAILLIGLWMEFRVYNYIQLSNTYYYTAPYILMGTGALITVVGSLAYCCTAKGQPILLYLFSAFLLIMFVVILTVAISGYAFRSQLRDGFKVGLRDALDNYDRNPEKEIIFNMMQRNLKCCGKNNYTDWFETSWANKTRSVPASCCKPEINQEHSCQHRDITSQTPQGIYTQGCYNAVLDFVNGNLSAIGAVALGIAFFQLIGVFLACCLAKNINKAKYEEVA